MEAPVNNRKSTGFVEQDKLKTVETGSNGGTGNTPAPSLKIPFVPKFPVALISDRAHYIKAIVSICQCLCSRSELTSSNACLSFTEMRPF